MVSSIVACLLAGVIQGYSLDNIFTATVDGFNVSMVETIGITPESLPAGVAPLVNQGGIIAMVGMILIIFCAYAFAGIISKSGCIEVVVDKLMKRVKTTGGLILTTVLSSILVMISMGHTYITIIIVGDAYKGVYKERVWV